MACRAPVEVFIMAYTKCKQKLTSSILEYDSSVLHNGDSLYISGDVAVNNPCHSLPAIRSVEASPVTLVAHSVVGEESREGLRDVARERWEYWKHAEGSHPG